MAGWSTAVFVAMMLSSGHGLSLVDVLFGSPQQSPGAGLSSSSSSSASSSSSGGTGSSPDGLALFAGALGSSSGGLESSAGGLGSSSGGLGSSAGGLGSSAGGLGSSAGGLGLFNSLNLGSANQLTAQPQGFCTPKEKQILFRKCAMSFGMSHIMYFNYLAMRPTCDARVFNCRKVDEMIKCVNSQPVTLIGNECWPAVKQTIAEFLNNYKIPCTYEHLKARCKHSSVDLIPVDKRKMSGHGINGFPLHQFLMIYSMMSMMQGGAGLFPMAA